MALHLHALSRLGHAGADIGAFVDDAAAFPAQSDAADDATRAAVAAWGLETCALHAEEASNALTAVIVPEGWDAEALRTTILERFDMSLGTGLGTLKGRVFRIGHLGDLNALTLLGTLAGVEMGLSLAGVPHESGGVAAAMEYLTKEEEL